MGLPHHNDMVFGPDQLLMLRGVFDAVWDECGWEYLSSPAETEIGRLRLANAVFGARRGMTDAALIKAVVLRRMAMWRHECRFAL
jgi:hypothetical protein